MFLLLGSEFPNNVTNGPIFRILVPFHWMLWPQAKKITSEITGDVHTEETNGVGVGVALYITYLGWLRDDPLFSDFHLSINARDAFLESPETFRVHLTCQNSPCIFKTNASGWNFGGILIFIPSTIYKKTSGSAFYEWLFAPEKFSGLSRNGPNGLLPRPTQSANGDDTYRGILLMDSTTPSC